MTRVAIDIIVRRPLELVFSFISHFENNPQWQGGVVKAWLTSPGPLAAGSTLTQLSRFLGRDIEFHFKVLRFEPGRLAEFTTESGTFPVQILREVEGVPDGTRVRALITGEAGGVFKLAAPLLDSFTKRQIEADYAKLKALLESQAA